MLEGKTKRGKCLILSASVSLTVIMLAFFQPDVQHEYREISETNNEYDRVARQNERVDIV